MIEITLGVCLGILAAVFILNWWQDHLVRQHAAILALLKKD